MADLFSRWLRAVRPSSPADGGFADTPDGDRALAAIHDRLAAGERAKARPLARRRIWLPAGALAAAAAVTAAALALTGSSTPTPPPSAWGGPPPGTSTELPDARPAAMLLSGYSSCADLLAGLRSHTAAHVTPYGLSGEAYFGMRYDSALSQEKAGLALPSASAPAAGQPGGGTSTTNDQVAGVDEPDIMKTDGSHVVTVTDGTLRVTDVTSDTVTGSLGLRAYDGWQSAQLLVDGAHAVVLMGGQAGSPQPYALGPMGPYVPPTGTGTTALFVDLSGTPSVTGTLHVDGAYLDARLVGPTIRMVVDSAPTINFPVTGRQTKARNQSVVRRAPLAAWLPDYTVTVGSNSTRQQVPCDAISHPVHYTGTSMITVYTLDIADPGAGPQPVGVVADGQTVYATSSSLYVASNPGWWSPGGPTATPTEIHRFDITGTGKPIYLGSGSVPGRLLSQYSLDEYDGYLRVATTGVGRNESNGVYVLAADTLAVAGHVRGLGHNEQLDAVRFAGPLAYVVTYRRVDPLYIVDLSDPAKPKVAGTLTMSGYSTYLHDAGNGRVIGVGEQIGKNNEPTGLQVSVFDVSAPSAPVRTSHVVRAGSSGEGQLDPHAFLYWQPTGLVAVPIQSWNRHQSGAALVLKLHGTSLATVGTVRNPIGTAVADDGRGIQRSMLVDGKLWTLSGSGLQVVDPASLARQAWIPFS